MSSVVAFHYQLHSLLACAMLEGLSNITTQNMLPTMWPQKTNKLDDRKKFQFYRSTAVEKLPLLFIC